MRLHISWQDHCLKKTEIKGQWCYLPFYLCHSVFCLMGNWTRNSLAWVKAFIAIKYDRFSVIYMLALPTLNHSQQLIFHVLTLSCRLLQILFSIIPVTVICRLLCTLNRKLLSASYALICLHVPETVDEKDVTHCWTLSIGLSMLMNVQMNLKWTRRVTDLTAYVCSSTDIDYLQPTRKATPIEPMFWNSEPSFANKNFQATAINLLMNLYSSPALQPPPSRPFLQTIHGFWAHTCWLTAG